MPLSEYFKGDGRKVMASMRRTYKDPEKAKRVFYATANKRDMNPDSPMKSTMRKMTKKRG